MATTSHPWRRDRRGRLVGGDVTSTATDADGAAVPIDSLMFSAMGADGGGGCLAIVSM